MSANQKLSNVKQKKKVIEVDKNDAATYFPCVRVMFLPT